MRLIHCSDLHLDSKMESNLTPKQARERKAEIAGTFTRMVRWANEYQVDAILVAGDLFDTGRVSAKTTDLVLDTIANAEQIQFFYLKGNHDESRDVLADRNLPENLHTFDDGWTQYRMGHITIAGLELNKDNWAGMYDSLNLSPEDVNIVMLHGQESTQPGEELISIPKLRGKHIDYLALGHIHSRKEAELDDRGVYAYCGCLEGRGFDECGQKGFVLLDVDGGFVKTEFVPFATRTLWEIPVDITDAVTVTQIRTAMETASAEISPEDLVKFTLTGSFTPETQKDLDFLNGALGERFWFVKIKDESRFRIEPETYEHDASLKGEFVRLVMASDRSEEDKAKIICAGLQALAGEEVVL